MIDLNSWPAIHALIYLASPFVLGGAGLLIGLYLGYSHRLPAMLEALRNSKDINFNTRHCCFDFHRDISSINLLPAYRIPLPHES